MISSVASLATPEEKPASPELKSRLVSTCNFLLKKNWKPITMLCLPKVPVFRCQKMALWVPIQKNRDHFLMPISPQNGEGLLRFRRLALFGGF